MIGILTTVCNVQLLEVISEEESKYITSWVNVKAVECYQMLHNWTCLWSIALEITWHYSSCCEDFQLLDLCLKGSSVLSNDRMYLMQITGCQPVLAPCFVKVTFLVSFIHCDIVHLLILFAVSVCAIIQLWMRLFVGYCNYCSW